MTVNKLLLTAGLVTAGLLTASCQGADHQATDTSASAVAGTSASSTQKSDSKFKDFTPPTDPCSLVDVGQLNNQGAGPIKAKKLSDTGTHIQECSYDDAAYNTVLDVTLISNPDGVSNYRDFKLRVIQSAGVDMYVMVDEPDKCSVGLLGPNDGLVGLKFTPSDDAIKTAALPAGQTWCDFSVPVIAEASKKLGWTK